jgi:hypothetical protein
VYDINNIKKALNDKRQRENDVARWEARLEEMKQRYHKQNGERKEGNTGGSKKPARRGNLPYLMPSKDRENQRFYTL